MDDSGSGRSGTGGKVPLRERLSAAMLKPAMEAPEEETAPPTLEELVETERRANDKERLIGLVAAPIAAAIAFLVTSAQIANDPPAHLKSGAVDKLHVAPSLYYELGAMLVVLAVVVLVAAMMRKRFVTGAALALYGLGVFNLHYWGFGFPFVLAGAWYLVRAYRVHQDVKNATAPVSPGGSTAARPNSRYTPPRSRSGR